MLLGQKRLAVLVDPESVPRGDGWLDLINAIQRSQATDVFVGGSLVGEGKTEPVVRALKDAVTQPVVLFPGAPNQVVQGADALLYLSLISGRNPDLLIGRHVESAPRIVKMGIPTVATGYMLLGDPPLTAAAYISHSLPIPMHKPELAVATAQAGCLAGLAVHLHGRRQRRGHPHLQRRHFSRPRGRGRAHCRGGRHDLPNRFGSRLGGRCHLLCGGHGDRKGPRSPRPPRHRLPQNPTARVTNPCRPA